MRTNLEFNYWYERVVGKRVFFETDIRVSVDVEYAGKDVVGFEVKQIGYVHYDAYGSRDHTWLDLEDSAVKYVIFPDITTGNRRQDFADDVQRQLDEWLEYEAATIAEQRYRMAREYA